MNGGFEHPIAFALLTLVPLIAIFYALALRARRAAMARLLDDAPVPLSRAAGRDRRAFEAALATLTFCLVVLALAGPRFGRDKEKVRRNGADVIVVLDVSRSMLAQDITPSRLDRARREIRGLMDSASGDRVALITFAGDARIACPLTLDLDTLGMFVDEADPNIDHRGGSNLASALDLARTALEASAGAGKAIVVLSDGEDFGGGKGSAAVAAAARLAAVGAHVYAIGLGTREGAKIPTVDERGKSRFFVDAHGKEVVTKLESETLEAVSVSGGGEYLDAAAVAFPMDELWNKRISRLARGDNGEEDVTAYRARFQWLLFPAILAGALWWIVPLGLFGSMREKRRRAAALLPSSPRAAALLALALLLRPHAARADGVDDGAKGDELYQKKDFDGAAAAYESAAKAVAAPNGPFNLGNAKFRAKKYPDAAEAWAEAEKRSTDTATRRDAFYNRASALLAQGSDDDPKKVETLRASIDAYSDALRLDPADPDARRNRAIAIARWVDAQKSKKGGKQKNPDAPKGDGEKSEQNAQSPGAKPSDPKPDEKDGKGGEKPAPSPSDPDAKDGKSQDGKPQDGKPQDGQAAVNPQELERLERMLDQRERAQRELQQRKAKMHRQPGENEW